MINAVIFDLYGTLIDIRTDEKAPEVYWTLSRYLSYQGVKIGHDRLQEAYFEGIQRQIDSSQEAFAEVNVYEIFASIMHKYGRGLYNEQIIVDVCMLYRSLTIRHFTLFPEVIETLSYLQSEYLLGLVSDAQWTFTEPELAMLNLEQFFPVRVLSSRYGYKKPDTRMFKRILDSLGVSPKEAVYIGDNPQRDLIGAKNSGMACILFRNEYLSHNGYEADALMRNYSELRGILKRLNS